MKNAVLLGLVLVFIIVSCKKQTDPVIPPPFYPPNDTTKHTAYPIQAILDVPNGTTLVYNAWGKLTAMKTDSVSISFVGDTTHKGGEYALAFFTDSTTSTDLDAGAVSLNNITLNHYAGNYPYNGPTDSVEYMDNWTVSGSSKVPAFSYNYNTSFPTYTGTLPYAITKADGLSFTFNASTVPFSDSIYVIITTTDQNGKVANYSKCFSATAGKVTITGSDFNYLPATPVYRANLTLIPFRYTTAAYGDKKFVFIKQSEISHNVSVQ